MFCPERSLPGGRPFRMKRMSLLAGMPGGGIKHKVMVEVSASRTSGKQNEEPCSLPAREQQLPGKACSLSSEGLCRGRTSPARRQESRTYLHDREQMKKGGISRLFWCPASYHQYGLRVFSRRGIAECFAFLNIYP